VPDARPRSARPFVLAAALAALLALPTAAAVRLGTPDAEILTGTDGADKITGDAGNDSLLGLAGNDTYYFADGWGTDLLEEKRTYRVDGKQLPGGRDTLSFRGVKNGAVDVRLVPEWRDEPGGLWSGASGPAGERVELRASLVENAVGTRNNGTDILVGGGGPNSLATGGGENDDLLDFGGYDDGPDDDGPPTSPKSPPATTPTGAPPPTSGSSTSATSGGTPTCSTCGRWPATRSTWRGSAATPTTSGSASSGDRHQRDQPGGGRGPVRGVLHVDRRPGHGGAGRDGALRRRTGVVRRRDLRGHRGGQGGGWRRGRRGPAR
jgi:Ca2+-binding RTX toxin-like protein